MYLQSINIILFTNLFILINRHLRKYMKSKNIFVLMNKTEGLVINNDIEELYENRKYSDIFTSIVKLGYGFPIPISSEHSEGISDLYEVLFPLAKYTDEELKEVKLIKEKYDKENNKENIIQIAIIGRPNVGKSTLINKLIESDRLITSPMPGTTRENIKVEHQIKDKKIILVDTAGIHKSMKRDPKKPLDLLSLNMSYNAINFSNIVVLVMDGDKLMTRIDESLANKIYEEGRGLVVVLNKGDLIENRSTAKSQLLDYTQQKFPNVYIFFNYLIFQFGKIPSLIISAKSGFGVDSIYDLCLQVYENWNRKIATSKLNKWLEIIATHKPPPKIGNRETKLKYITQVGTRPPSFLLFSNTYDVSDGYKRFLVSKLREEFDFNGVPVRLNIKVSENPYMKKKKMGIKKN